MKAGVGIRNITLPEFIKGNPIVHDPLYARAFVLDDGETSIAIISVDQKGFNQLHGRIREELGIEHTLINSVHTHSDGEWWSAQDGKWRGRKQGFLDALKPLVWDAVKEASANRVPVSLHAGRAPVEIGYNRYGAAYTQAVVPWANVLEARMEDGKPLAVLFDHAAHPVMTMSSGTVSADYPGHAIKHVNEALGSEAMPIFALACAGNINGDPVGFSIKEGWHEKAEAAGRKLGDAVLTAMGESTELTTDKLAVRSQTLMLPCQLPSKELWEEIVRRLHSEVPVEVWFDIPASTKSLEIVKGMMKRGEQPEVPLEINVVSLASEWCLVTMSGEIFTEYEVWANAASPFDHTMVWGYTNFDGGYIPTDNALALGAKTPLHAEHACMEAAGWPSFFHGVHAQGAHVPLAVGIEGPIKETIVALWTLNDE